MRLGSLCLKIGSGSTPAGGRAVYTTSGPILIRSQNVYDEGLRLDDVAHFSHETYLKRGSHVKARDILLNITGASIGRCAIVPDPFEEADVNQHVLILRLIDYSPQEYLHLAMISPVVQGAIMEQQVGATKEGLSATKAGNLLIPLPPLREQKHICDRIEQILVHISQYDALETAREQLDAELPDRLRKSILQMAVQGKLVPQDPNDEPASVLLERIREQRRQLIAEGKIKAPKGGESVIYRGSDGGYYEKCIDAKGRESKPACIDDEIPFKIPESWEWARLGSLAEFGGGGTPDKGNASYWNGDIPWASMKDIHGRYLSSTIDSITLEGLRSKPSITLCKPGQIIVSTRLAPGKTILSKITCAINQDLKVVHTNFPVDYLLLWFESRLDYFKKLGMGTTVPGIKLNDLKSALLPVPSRDEIPRIVSLLNKLSNFTN